MALEDLKANDFPLPPNFLEYVEETALATVEEKTVDFTPKYYGAVTSVPETDVHTGDWFTWAATTTAKIKEYRIRAGYSVREIQNILSFSSPEAVYAHLYGSLVQR